ncbi:unnamed protein product [Dicrocoelium dendriticum]|nr:unnamed protein product [Dicrocoelium dendriticum]
MVGSPRRRIASAERCLYYVLVVSMLVAFYMITEALVIDNLYENKLTAPHITTWHRTANVLNIITVILLLGALVSVSTLMCTPTRRYGANITLFGLIATSCEFTATFRSFYSSLPKASKKAR